MKNGICPYFLSRKKSRKRRIARFTNYPKEAKILQVKMDKTVSFYRKESGHMAKKSKKLLPVKWEPVMNDMLSFKKSIDRQFESFFSSHPFITKLPSMLKEEFTRWRPEVDMYETNKDIIVRADIPGCDKKDISVKIDHNILTIFGKKEDEKEIKKRDFYHKEQHMGSFFRKMTLPNYADVSKSKAAYEKGVLKIIFPKTKAAYIKGKTIEISDRSR